MVKKNFNLALPLLLILFIGSATADNKPEISAQTHQQRRDALLEMLPDSSVAVFHAALEKKRSNDVDYEYRQDNNLLYLTGMNMPGSALILVKNSGSTTIEKGSEQLFIPENNPFRARVEGSALSVEEAKRRSGVKSVKGHRDFKTALEKLLPGQRIVFYSYPLDFFHERLSNQRIFLATLSKEALHEKYPKLEVKSPDDFLVKLRQIKSEEELAVLQKAIDITCEALAEAMRTARPGQYEYQIEAVIEYVFKNGGAAYPAFPSIVGSGPNSTVLHYWKNERQTQPGDLVVMDVGAEYLGYSADVTRTIPVAGKFSREQREIYEIVLRAQQAGLQAVRPGVTLGTIHEAAKQVIDAAGYGQYFIHGTSHYLGLDTHDVGDRGPLQAGMVITVEPGIYIPAGAETSQAYWNIGVRIEDDVLVTENSYKVLSGSVPRDIAGIERLMRQDRKWIKARQGN